MNALLFFSLGACAGFLLFWLLFHFKKRGFRGLSEALLLQAERDARRREADLELRLKEREFSHTLELNAWAEEGRKKRGKEEERLKEREERLEQKWQIAFKKWSEIEKREEWLERQKEELDATKQCIEEREKRLFSELQILSNLSGQEAKELLLQKVEREITLEMAKRGVEIRQELQESIEEESAKLLADSLGRLALSATHEHAVTTVPLPSDEMKGRIIGREGRNIRLLEQLTGVNFVVDEAPGAVCLSCFDPIRRQIAKIALSDLIQDGRIHPTRIEEAVEKGKSRCEKEIRERGIDALRRAGVPSLHPELITLLGKLSFRYSLGQNVLEHSIEVASLMGMWAAEMRLDEELARKIGLLHDIGKAVSHEIAGSHAMIGHDFALKYGESAECAAGIGCHHHEMPPTTVVGALCPIADQISGSRLGARSEAIEQRVRRVTKLETLSSQFPGVEMAYALQAGREVRVVVVPEIIDDHACVQLAKALAKRIEEELTFPGKIKVTVIREKKAVEYAT